MKYNDSDEYLVVGRREDLWTHSVQNSSEEEDEGLADDQSEPVSIAAVLVEPLLPRNEHI
jgi:hypothetical protein